jgi:NodT family efflux transporter outer membrane factor (OMF) lipoprotein
VAHSTKTSRARQRLKWLARQSRLRTALIAILLALLSGCIQAEKPELALDIPRTYRDATGGTDAALPPLDWWRGFRSSEFTALMEEAQAANLDIAAAVARILQADAQARLAGAPLLPTVNFDANATRSQISVAGSGADNTASVNRQRTQYNVALNASYEIDFWGKNRAALLAAEQLAIASRFARDVVALSTQASVANGYFQVLAAQERLRIARENLASATRILNLIRQRLNVGTASSLDIAQQETLVANQRAAIPLLEQVLRQNTATLSVLMGRPPEVTTIRGGSLTGLNIPRVTPGIPSDLLFVRPDIRQAESQLASANANVTAARAAFFPSIQLTANGGYQSAALQTLFTPQAAFYNAAASLTQPIFDGFRLQSNLDIQRGRQDELLLNYRRAIISAFADVDIALVAVRQSGERERLLREAVMSSRRAFELTETRLREGTVDLITVLSVQQTLFGNEDALVQARLARLMGVVSLYQALGGGWLLPKEGRRRAR